MLVPDNIARRVARIIYEADCEVRHQVSEGFADHGERGYLSSILTLSIAEIRRLFGELSGLTLRLDGRDRHLYDGIFVFRVGNEIKIGICEAKLLRFIRPNGNERNLDDEWDWESNGESHFYNQISDFDNWTPDCATWIMLMSDLHHGEHSPPIDEGGSSCIWQENIREHMEENDIDQDHFWTFQNVLDIDEDRITNLESIIYDILICNKGTKITVGENANYVNVRYGTTDQIRINVPLPSINPEGGITNDNSGVIVSFLNNYNFSSYTYIKMKNLKGTNEF